MSLLMQALKKAEQAKQKPSDDDAPKDASLPPTAEPAKMPAEPDSFPATRSPAAAAHDSIPPPLEPSLSPSSQGFSALSLEALEQTPPKQDAREIQMAAPEYQPAPPAASPSPPATAAAAAPRPQPAGASIKAERHQPPRASEEHKQAAARAAEQTNLAQEKAKSVFSSKQPPPARTSMLGVGIGLAVVLLLAVGGFYYWQTNMQRSSFASVGSFHPHTPLSASAIRHGTGIVLNPTADTSSNPNPTPQAINPGTATAQASVAPEPPVNTGRGTPGSVHVRTNALRAGKTPYGDSRRTLSSTKEATPIREQQPAIESPKELATQTPSTDDIRIQKNTTPEGVDASLANGYHLYKAGDFSAAKPLYEKVLRDDPNNRDALLGLAAIALDQKQGALAGSLYSKLLDLNPTDPDAAAGLTSLGRGDPERSESMLKKVLAQNPQSGPALFELGNLYAQQMRWSEAQQSYFRAFTTAHENADYAFNLAISLDRLGQNKLALEYYQRAVALSKESPGHFALSDVQSRIDQLQQTPREKHAE